jgi:hypothetical protein
MRRRMTKAKTRATRTKAEMRIAGSFACWSPGAFCADAACVA